MTALIDLNDIESLRSISLNIDFDSKVKPHVLDAQEFDLRPLIGEEFWIELADDVSAFPDLWEGLTYTHQGHTYQHPGLKAVLVMFAYARYKGSVQQTDTAYGLVVKTNEHSTPVSDRTLARAEAKAKSGAEIYWTRVRDYLCRKSTTYPLWKGGSSGRLTGNGLRIRKVSKY
jgi:hypothetical protein